MIHTYRYNACKVVKWLCRMRGRESVSIVRAPNIYQSKCHFDHSVALWFVALETCKLVVCLTSHMRIGNHLNLIMENKNVVPHGTCCVCHTLGRCSAIIAACLIHYTFYTFHVEDASHFPNRVVATSKHHLSDHVRPKALPPPIAYWSK